MSKPDATRPTGPVPVYPGRWEDGPPFGPGGDHECDPRNPFRPIDWRWRRASLAPPPTSREGRRLDDAWVRGARRHLADRDRVAAGKRRTRLAMRRAIDGAMALRDARSAGLRDEVEIRLLAGQDDATIAIRCGLTMGVIAAYAALLYDVRALLDHPDALIAQAVGPCMYGADGGRWAALRLVAYHFGPIMVDALLGRRGEPGVEAGADGPRPEAVEGFELLVKVRGLDLEEVGLARMMRLYLFSERLDARTPPPELPARPVPVPDIAGLRAATLPRVDEAGGPLRLRASGRPGRSRSA